MEGMSRKPPVLVTGMHRSGTTWAGHMLCAGGDFVRLGEPLSPVNRQTILPRQVGRWYTYVDSRNEAEFLQPYHDALRFRAHPIEDVRRARLSPRDPGRIVERWGSYALGRAQDRRTLFHDPFAVFSAGWFVGRLGAQVVLLFRHPLSLVSGLKRLGWAFDFRNLSEQRELMDDLLSPYREEIERVTPSQDIVEQGCLLWRIVYETVSRRFSSEPSIHIVRHEDLSLDADAGFRRLYGLLHLDYDEKARATIVKSSSSDNPPELRQDDPDSVRVDSRANLGNWRHRLGDDEVERILESTQSAVALFYSDADVQNLLGRGET